MSKEITITNANNSQKFISFNLNGLKDGIIVGSPDKYSNWITVAYKGETKIVPFDATSKDLEELNSDENVIKPSSLKEDDDTRYWQSSHVTELDDEAFDAFEKEIMNPEPDMERVKAAKKIFEGVDKIKVDRSDLWKDDFHNMLEMLDEWGVDRTNYAEFRCVIQEHCFDKGIYDLEEIKNTWEKIQKGLDQKRIQAAEEILRDIGTTKVEKSDLLLELMKELGVDIRYYNEFGSVIEEHCLEKGIYSPEEIKNTWEEFRQGLKEAAEEIRDLPNRLKDK